MITTNIKLKTYLKEFLIHLYGEEPIKFNDSSDVLAYIHELRIKRPRHANEDNGENTTIVIPYQRYGKDPRTYNYLTPKAQTVIQTKIHTLFAATLNDYIAHKVYILSIDYHTAIEMFAQEYGIKGITLEGLKQKNYRDRAGKRFTRRTTSKD